MDLVMSAISGILFYHYILAVFGTPPAKMRSDLHLKSKAGVSPWCVPVMYCLVNTTSRVLHLL